MLPSDTVAAMAYLDIAEPKSEPWMPGDAERWLRGRTRQAEALRAALSSLGYELDEVLPD